MIDSEPDIETSFRRSFLRLTTNLWVVLGSIASMFVGAGAVWWASGFDVRAVGVAVGASFLAVGALALASEVLTRRLILKETFAMVNLRDEITTAGMTALHPSRNKLDSVFSHVIKRAKKVDLMFVSATTWLSSNEQALREMLRGGGRVRLLIPDPTDDTLLAHLLTRFEHQSLEQLRTDVQHAVNLAHGLADAYPPKFRRRRHLLGQGQPTVAEQSPRVHKGMEIRRLTVVPTYSFYRVDDMGVLRVHEVRKQKAHETPVLVFGKKGTLHGFAREDFRDLYFSADNLVRKAPLESLDP